MTAGLYNFTIEQGATFRKTITWKDENSAPIDLTGCTARLKAKRGSTTVSSLTDGTGMTLGGPAGTIELLISDEATAALAFDIVRYDLEVEFPNGDVRRALQGSVTLAREVTV